MTTTFKTTQRSIEIEHDLDEVVNGREDRQIKGTMTIMPKKDNPNGSFSIKITSGLVSGDPDERAAVLKAAQEATENAYDHLLNELEAVRQRNLSQGGQLDLGAELDAAVPDKISPGSEFIDDPMATDEEQGVPQEANAD